MKKIILTVFLCAMAVLGVFSRNVLNLSYADDIASVTVLTPTPLYKQASIKSDLYTSNLPVGTVLTLDNTSPQNDETFYRVLVYGVADGASQDDVGYVLRAHTLDSTITSPSRTLDDNGKIKNDNTPVYERVQVPETNNYVYNKVENIILSKDTPIQVLDGYDKNKEYTYIAFYGESGDIVRYYVETSNLSVPGINWSIIVAISTLITCVTILAIIFGIKGRKKKKVDA